MPTLRRCADMSQRRDAALRLPVLDGGYRDPLDALRDPEPLTRAQLDGWVATVEHLTAHGLPPVVPGVVAAALATRARKGER